MGRLTYSKCGNHVIHYKVLSPELLNVQNETTRIPPRCDHEARVIKASVEYRIFSNSNRDSRLLSI